MNPNERPKVIKKSRILRGHRVLSAPQSNAHGLTVRTETTDGDVSGLVVSCGCGAEARIECVYDAAPAAKKASS